MHPIYVSDAARRLGVEVPRIFGLSFEYAEEPHTRSWIVNQYNKWVYDNILHPTVEDFVIDVMAGRVLRQEVKK